MIKFRIKNTDFIFCFSFFAVTSLFCIIQENLNILSAFSVCLIHETGHLIPIVFLGEKIKKVELCCAGIRIIPYENPLRPFRNDISILIGGVCTNFLTAIFLIAFLPDLYEFAVMNIVIAVFNLMPYRCTDGGAIILKITDYYFPEKIRYHADWIIRIISFSVSALIVFIAVFSGISNATLIITSIYLAIISI